MHVWIEFYSNRQERGPSSGASAFRAPVQQPPARLIQAFERIISEWLVIERPSRLLIAAFSLTH